MHCTYVTSSTNKTYTLALNTSVANYVNVTLIHLICLYMYFKKAIKVTNIGYIGNIVINYRRNQGVEKSSKFN